MQMRNPNRYQSIAIIEPNESQAYRLKARLLAQGYRRVDVFLSQDAFREATEQGYVPDHVVTGAAAGVPAQ
jgi:hypothetical protein